MYCATWRKNDIRVIDKIAVTSNEVGNVKPPRTTVENGQNMSSLIIIFHPTKTHGFLVGNLTLYSIGMIRHAKKYYLLICCKRKILYHV